MHELPVGRSRLSEDVQVLNSPPTEQTEAVPKGGGEGRGEFRGSGSGLNRDYADTRYFWIDDCGRGVHGDGG